MSDFNEFNTQPDSHGRLVSVKKRKRGACAKHCRRFWWLHLIISCCVAALIVCLVIFVGVPHIVQAKVNDVKLDMQAVSLMQTQPESYTLSISSTITTDSFVKAKVYGFNCNMYLEDLPPHTPFATLDFPDTHGERQQTINITQRLKISESKAFGTFNTWFFNNETLRVTLDGRTQVQPSGLRKKFGVTFRKTMALKGLNRFAGTKVFDGHISLDPGAVSNFNGTANIPNPSIFTLDVGNATFKAFAGENNVGSLNISNFVLRPGDNAVNIVANLDQVAIMTDLTSPAYCKSGVIPFKLQGDEVVNHGNLIPYFEAALSSANQTINMDIGSIIRQDLNATIGCYS